MILKKNNELKKFPNSRDGTGKASVIDLGSNSVKMVNYNVDSQNSYKPYHQESSRIKLAEGLVDGIIQTSHIEKTIDTLKFFRNIIDFEQIDYVIAVATSAVRDAKNKEDFLIMIISILIPLIPFIIVKKLAWFSKNPILFPRCQYLTMLFQD